MQIPYGKQHISDEDIQAVVEVLKADFLTQGPKIAEFEENFARYIGSKYAVAVANGTAALHLSAMVLNVQKGDKVITSPNTFAASANCVLYTGGEVLFADIDPATYVIDLNRVEDTLRKEKNVKGIIPVDFAGYPVAMDEFRALADKYSLWILEDACHAPGAEFVDRTGEWQTSGNGVYNDLAIYSFHPVKHIACGEGGMITSNNEEYYKRLLHLRTHGITKHPGLLEENHGGWYYEMQELGYNYRLTDMQCALGNSQLKRASEGLAARRRIASKYNEAFNNLPLVTPNVSDKVWHAYHLYVIRTDKRKELYDFLRQHSIFAQVHYIPVHLQPYYKKLGWKKGDFPEAEKYYEECLSLPMYPSLTEEEQKFVIDTIKKFFS